MWTKRPTELRIETRSEGDATRVILAGELDISGEDRLDQILRTVEAAHPAKLVVDLRPLDFMDSTGLRVLIAAHARATDAGRHMEVVHNSGQVRQVFELTGVGTYLKVVEA